MIFKIILKFFFSAKTQWFLLQIEWGIHFFWSHGSEKSTFFRIWTFSWLSAWISHFFDQKGHNFDYFFQKFWKNFFSRNSDFGRKLSAESIFFGPMALQKSVLSEFELFRKMSKRDIFEKYWWFKVLYKNIFLPKHSDFDVKLSEESIFHGPKALWQAVFSEFGLFHSHFSLF